MIYLGSFFINSSLFKPKLDAVCNLVISLSKYKLTSSLSYNPWELSFTKLEYSFFIRAFFSSSDKEFQSSNVFLLSEEAYIYLFFANSETTFSAFDNLE